MQPPDALLSRGLEVHPFGGGEDLEIWIDRSYVPAGYGWSFPADGEVRIGIGSFDPRFHVKDPTNRLAADLDAETVRYQGNWIPHALRPATEDGIFFVGDSAGHCLPLTAEGIRTALYFGIACGRRAARRDRRRAAPVARRWPTTTGSRPDTPGSFSRCCAMQRLIPRVAPRLLAPALRATGTKRFVDWAFNHYLNIAHPSFAQTRDAPARSRRTAAAV